MVAGIINLFGAAVTLALILTETVSALSTAARDTTTNPVIVDSIHRDMIEIHNAEVANGRNSFSDESLDFGEISSWDDDAFIARNLGQNNVGVDAKGLPKNGNMIFESVSPVLSENECSFIIEEARETILQGLIQERSESPPEDGRPYSMTNSQLGEARLSSMPKTREWLKKTLPTRFYPLLKDRFGVEDLVLYDGLVLGDHAPSRSQPIHRDASLLTLNVALSALADFDGGGTYVEALDEILLIEKGHLLCHAGSAMHAGNAVTRGERWVFVLFLLGENQPQLARRCHAKAIEHMRLGEIEQAETYLQTGLQSIAPEHDHLLHGTLGRLQLGKGEKAFQSFRLADKAYPICQNALVSMAQILMDRRRPRAALRRLDQALERIDNRDLLDSAQLSLKALGYGARRDAARCALLCADHLYRNEGSELWILEHIPTAISRLNTCLAAAPEEPTLLGMLDRAEYLVSQVQSK